MEASKANSKANSKEPVGKEPVGKEPVGKEPAENGKPARSSKPAEKSSLRLPPSVSLSRSIRLPYSGRHNTEPVAGAAALSVSALCVSYPGASEPALKEANLELPAGVRAALVGANGSGKSTLLKAVAGLLPALSGDIEIYGNPVGACHHRVAYLPQRGDIDWRFPISVSRLVLGGRYVHLGWLRRPGRKDRQVAKEVMERLGIEPLAGRQIGELSGGQQQRALLARALAQQADLLLLDEPLAGVDAATQQAVFNVLEELKGEGRTLVVATHDLERLEEEFEGVVYLKEGRVVEPVAGAYVGIDFRKQATGEQAAS